MENNNGGLPVSAARLDIASAIRENSVRRGKDNEVCLGAQETYFQLCLP